MRVNNTDKKTNIELSSPSLQISLNETQCRLNNTSLELYTPDDADNPKTTLNQTSLIIKDPSNI